MRHLLLLLMMLALPMSLAFGYSSGPPNGMAGDPPGMNNCTQCHGSFPVNSGSGSLSLDAITEYTPGETYSFTVELSDPDAARWGFELIPLDDANTPAGAIAVTNMSRTQLNGNYLKHTSGGTDPGTTGSSSWSFDWTAPAENTGDVTFYFAGNAANNNGSTSGDRIYTASLIIPEMTSGVEDGFATSPESWQVDAIYPNPFNNAVTVTVTAAGRANTTVEVYDILGRQVGTLHRGALTPGSHSFTWQPRSAAGLYFLRASNDQGWSEIRRLQYVK